MAVRRLAPDEVQPASFAFTPENTAWMEATIAKYPEGKQASAVIPMLMRAQDQDGWVTRAAIEWVAQKLGMARIRVLEIATFYTQFQLAPVGKRAHVQVCGTTPCMLRGSDEIIRICKSRIHAEQHHLSADGNFSWEEVECLGACVNAPMVAVFKDTYEDLTPESFTKVLDEFAAGRTPQPGPQNGRHGAVAEGGQTTLTDPGLYNGAYRRNIALEAAPEPAAAAPAATPSPAPAAQAVKPAAQAAAAEAKPAIPTTPAAPAVAPSPAAETAKRADTPAERVEPTSGSIPAASGLGDAGSASVAGKPGDTATGRGSGQALMASPSHALVAKPAESATPAAATGTGAGDKSAGGAPAEPEAVVSDDYKPTLLTAARDGQPDDLKLIWGVGPKLEAMLHSMGVFHFDQIAKWTDMNLRWVDQNLGAFKGRAVRDKWIEQSVKLASGWRPESGAGDKPKG